ncbi:MAG: phosphoglucosamine mutase [Gudongella sp.]|nr:phosphoglucosamine mutase [Gudongella sp.]
MGKLFGTDGVRGVANLELTPELAFKIGRAVGEVLTNKDKGVVVVGKDTRASGDMLEAALTAGLTSIGLSVMQLGIIPTPAVAYLTRKYSAVAGVVISASHNPGEYNGIKIFNSKGLKLADAIEEKIESIILNDEEISERPIKEHIGRVYINENGKRDYIEFLKGTINTDLSGMKIAMDCGNGALFEIGPILLQELGADVETINITPDGMNINKACGSTKPELVQQLVIEIGADLGVAFDGDADRIIAVDETGKIINGDHILAICGRHLKGKGKLYKDKVVGTVMTNIGLDIFLKENGLGIEKTAVGDRYILEKMIEEGYTLGGEQSGHIIFLEHNTTGDGMATALQILEIMKETKSKASDLNSIMSDYPQVLVNARVDNRYKTRFMEVPEIKAEVLKLEEMFHGKGRVLIRPSGTEPLVRVMIEGKDQEWINQKAIELANFIESKIGIK